MKGVPRRHRGGKEARGYALSPLGNRSENVWRPPSPPQPEAKSRSRSPGYLPAHGRDPAALACWRDGVIWRRELSPRIVPENLGGPSPRPSQGEESRDHSPGMSPLTDTTAACRDEAAGSVSRGALAANRGGCWGAARHEQELASRNWRAGLGELDQTKRTERTRPMEPDQAGRAKRTGRAGLARIRLARTPCPHTPSAHPVRARRPATGGHVCRSTSPSLPLAPHRNRWRARAVRSAARALSPPLPAVRPPPAAGRCGRAVTWASEKCDSCHKTL